MNVLVAVASPGEGAAEIGREIAGALAERGAGVRFLELDDDGAALPDVDPGSYDAVVLGSSVRAGRWLRPARQFIAEHTAALNSRPLWVFSSGDGGVASYGIQIATNPVEHRHLKPGSPEARSSAVAAWACEIASAAAKSPEW